MEKNRQDIQSIDEKIAGVGVGPQGPVGPQGAQGIQGVQGVQGNDGTLAPSFELLSVLEGGYSTLELYDNPILNNGSTPTFYRFIPHPNTNTVSGFDVGFSILVDGVLQSKKLGFIDNFLLFINPGYGVAILGYDEVGDTTTIFSHNTGINSFKLRGPQRFKIVELNISGIVGPQGVQGVQGPQGATGPQGLQGIQGLPGEQNLVLDATYTDGESFPEYTSQIMIQIIGGDYDGMTFIKESLEEDDVVKFGPYATLITITDPGTGIQINLQSGVTSVKIYTMANLT